MENLFFSEVWSPRPSFLRSGCFCLPELPSDAARLWSWMPLVAESVSAEVDILAPTSLPWQYVLGDYQHCLITFVAFIGMVNVDLYSSESLLLLLSAVTWSKQCPHHVQHMWFGPPANTRMFSSIIQIHTDLGFICLRNLNLGTSLNFCVRCLLTKCSLIFMITLLFVMPFLFYVQKNLFITDCDSDASPESWYTCIFWRVFLQVKETIPNKNNPFIIQFCRP